MVFQQTVDVDTKALLKLTQASLENNIEGLEGAATQLYKALQAGKDRGLFQITSSWYMRLTFLTDMAATMERLEEYRTYNTQFCKRLHDFLKIMCTAQAEMLLGNSQGITRPTRGRPSIADHKPLEGYLGRYGGLMLYLKEMDEVTYGKLCGVCVFLQPVLWYC